MTPAEFARQQGVSERTVQRWCEKGEVPGAQQQVQGSRVVWWLPADATRVVGLVDAADTSRHVAGATAPRRDVATVAPAPAVLAVPQPLTLAEAIARCPVYVPLERASTLLGISVHAIKANREQFEVTRLGRLVVPVRAIRKHAGLEPALPGGDPTARVRDVDGAGLGLAAQA